MRSVRRQAVTALATTSAGGPSDFVGRGEELAAMLAALEQASRGRGTLFLVGGEPGIGKSRLADEMSAHARATGATVLWGRCWEAGGAPAYWPWVQCLRSYLRSHDVAAVRRHIGAGGPDIAQLLPELSALLPDISPRPTSDSESARFRLFDATTGFLRDASREEVIVVVIDDLQVADTPSLLLLRFMASQLGDARIVVVATYRDVELTPDHPVALAIAEMAREPTTQHVTLAGLAVGDVADIARRNADLAPPPSLVVELHRQTKGNPLFVREAIKLLASEGRFAQSVNAAGIRFSVPGAVRDVITRRLGHLGDRSRGLLSLASVLGPEVPADVLRRLAETSVEELIESLDEAVSSGLLVEVAGALGRYRFSHDLIREVLYDDMSTAQRIRLHLRAGETLESLYAADPEPHRAEIAHHFFEAAPAADPSKVTEHARRAAMHAVRQLAYEEAVRLYGMALQAMELDAAADETARCDLLLDLGDAQMRAGETPRAKETFLGAAAIARRIGLAEHLARAALGYGGRFVWARAANDRQLIPLLQDALAALGDGKTVLRARVLARLAGALRDQPEAGPRDALSREAVEIARSVDDRATLAFALDGRYSAIWAPDSIDERLRIADEIVRIAEDIGDAERAFQGRHYRLAVLLERGEIGAVKAELELNSRLADELRQPAQRWYVRATVAILALLEGRYAEAESLIDEAFEHGRHAESVHARGVVQLQQYALRLEQGRAAEMELPLRSMLDEYAFWPWMRCALLHLYSRLDRRTDARSLLEAIAGDDFGALPRDNDWLMGMALLADVAVYLRDTPRAASLYELLAPFWDRNGYGHPEFCTGSVARSLGNLAAHLGRDEDADRYFTAALAMNRRMGALPWVAHTQRDYAAALRSRGTADGDRRARDLLAEALSTARELGMVALERRVAELSDDIAEEPGGAVKWPDATGTFRREGDFWTIEYDGVAFRLRDARGLHYLSRLLAVPGRELLALELAREAGDGQSGARHQVGEVGRPRSGDSGALLDDEAKRAYGERLLELQQELDEAESWNDPARAERVREEMDFLTRELRRAMGLGGRARIAGSDSERARVSVTRAIRLAMARVSDNSPALGAHLEAAVHTGTYCSYRPDPRTNVRWET